MMCKHMKWQMFAQALCYINNKWNIHSAYKYIYTSIYVYLYTIK